MNYQRIIFAAAQSASGKTTVTLGLMLALRKMGLKVQPFKAGPDYLDPLQHSAACGRISRNLDSWLMRPRVLQGLFVRNSKGSDISVIEGVMGLYDGFRDTQYGSTAHLAKILKTPVIIILNAASFSRSAAAIILGCRGFDKKVNLAGVILNNIGSPNHYDFAKSAIEQKTKIPVLGFLPKDTGIRLPERHLGLVPAGDKGIDKNVYRKLAALVEKNIDIPRVVKISRQAPGIAAPLDLYAPRRRSKVSIAIARDEAFNFYYQDNLDILKHLGARLIEFSPLRDKYLPKGVGGVYIGGGYPELFAAKLSLNNGLREALGFYAKRGLPIYGECGGLMYLVKNIIDFKGKAFPMAGIFDCSAVMARKRQALGYIEIDVIKDTILGSQGDNVRAHTFHWSYLSNIPENIQYAYRVRKGRDKVYYDGLSKENVLASYAHLHFASAIQLARNFVSNCDVYQKTI